MKGNTDTLLVAVTRPTEDKCLLVIGRKLPSQAVDIVNAIDGDEAEELYQKLITKRSKEESE